MTDVATQSQPSTTNRQNQNSPAKPAEPQSKPSKQRSKNKNKSRRRRPDDTDLSEGEAPNDHSANVDSQSSKQSTTPVAAFPDVSSVTPAVWADDPIGDDSQVIQFDDSNAGGKKSQGESKPTASSSRGGAKKVSTPHETKRQADRKAKSKEKQKAKKVRDRKRKDQEQRETGWFTSLRCPCKADGSDATPQVSKNTPSKSIGEQAESSNGVGKKQQVTDDSLVASTSALTLETKGESRAQQDATTQPTLTLDSTPSESASTKSFPVQPPSGPRASPGPFARPQPFEAGFGPRNMGSWRGRPDARGGFRGMWRGRGRGGFAPSFAPRGGFPKFGPHRAPVPPISAEPESSTDVPVSKSSDSAETTNANVATKQGSAQDKWGHDGFEAMQAVDRFQGNKLLMRGRGRGRGGFHVQGRGGSGPSAFGPHVGGKPQARQPNPQPAPRSRLSMAEVETPATQPSADSLLEEADAPLTIETQTTGRGSTPDLRGSVETLNPPEPTELPPSSAQAPVFVYPQTMAHGHRGSGFGPAFSDGSASPAPYGVAGSENGSVSSNGPAPHMSFMCPGVGYGSPVDFVPGSNSPYPSYIPHPQFPHAGYYPHAYSPDLLVSPQSDSFPSFGPMGLDPRSASPYPMYNPYSMPPGGAFYPPPKAGVPGTAAELKGYPPQAYYPQHYNPYAGMGPDPAEGYMAYGGEYGY